MKKTANLAHNSNNCTSAAPSDSHRISEYRGGLWVFNTLSNGVIIKYAHKGQYLMKLITSTDSLRTFLSKIQFFFTSVWQQRIIDY